MHRATGMYNALFLLSRYYVILTLRQFALTEAGYVMVRLAQRFEEIVGVDNSWESVESGGQGYVRIKANLTGCPADGVKVRMKKASQ